MHDSFIKIIQVLPSTDKHYKQVNGLQILRRILVQVSHCLQQWTNIITSSVGIAQAIMLKVKLPYDLQIIKQDCSNLFRSTSCKFFSFNDYSFSLRSNIHIYILSHGLYNQCSLFILY